MPNDDIFDEEERIADEQAAGLGNAILHNPIRTLTLRPPAKVHGAVTVCEAVDRMVEKGVGCVLVEERNRLIGIFTERDVLRKVIAADLDPTTTRVESVMTRNPETLSPESGIAYALNMMIVGGYRHIPLADDEGRAVGVVAMRNVVQYIVDLFPGEILNLPPNQGRNIARTPEGA